MALSLTMQHQCLGELASETEKFVCIDISFSQDISKEQVPQLEPNQKMNVDDILLFTPKHLETSIQ